MRTVQELLDLTGRSAVVTGGSGHLGRAAVAALSEAGASVYVMDLAEGEAAPGRFVECDLADEAATRAGVRQVIEHAGGLDIIVHCAALVGTSEGVPGWAVGFADQEVSAFEASLRVGVTAPFVLVQEAAEALAAQRRGSVILFGSIYGRVGPDPTLYAGTDLANPVGYGATKGGVRQLTRYLATMLAPDVRVNSISPGGVGRGQPDAFVGRYVDRTPLARMATEEDVKGAVAYLAGDLSAYVTGQDLVVDGGWTAW